MRCRARRRRASAAAAALPREGPEERLRDIGDVLGDIDDAKAGAESTARRSVSSARWKLATAAVIVVASVATASAWMLSSRGSPAAAPIRTSVTLPTAVVLDTADDTRSLAMSADGRRLAYVGTAAGRKGLYIRSLDAFDAKLIDGTDGARYPFFSPDGNWIAFFTDRQLKRVSLAGGAPIVVCDIPPIGRGASWGRTAYIVFTGETSGLMRVKAEGGEPTPIATLDPQIDGRRHTWPRVFARRFWARVDDRPADAGRSFVRDAALARALAGIAGAIPRLGIPGVPRGPRRARDS